MGRKLKPSKDIIDHILSVGHPADVMELKIEAFEVAVNESLPSLKSSYEKNQAEVQTAINSMFLLFMAGTAFSETHAMQKITQLAKMKPDKTLGEMVNEIVEHKLNVN